MNHQENGKRKWILSIVILLIIGILGYFKYANFAYECDSREFLDLIKQKVSGKYRTTKKPVFGKTGWKYSFGAISSY